MTAEHRTLLLEIGTEEIPARMLRQAATDLARLVEEALCAASLPCVLTTPLWTPRRLAVMAEGLPARLSDREEVVTGPHVGAAFDASGVPTRAAEGFARAQGVTPADLVRVPGPKGEVVAVRRLVPGRDTREVLAEALPGALGRLTFPRAMRWDGNRGPFVRPVHWICCLLGSDPVVFEFAGVRSGRATRGHRFLAPEPFDLADPAAYVEELRRRDVIVQPDERRARIRDAMARVEAESGARFVPDDALLDEVADLVECPVFGMGSFDPAFLALPREVLITAMAAHQRYFAVEDGRGNLVARFGVVSNTRARDPAVVVRGNERVLAARLYDARFFHEQDLKTGLHRMSERLGERLFLKGAGDMAEKSSRIAEVAVELCESAGLSLDLHHVRRAAALCKADLMSQMVGEFPTLEGVMGRYYALAAGEPEPVATAIVEHYHPRSAGDALPASEIGAVLAVADRVDSIATCFDVGAIPTGSRDPLGLRRQAIGLLKILIERAWRNVSPGGLFLRCKDDETREKAWLFVRERFQGILTEDYEVPTDFATAVLEAARDTPPSETVAMAVALRDFSRETEGFRDFLETVFKRVFNIVRQADDKMPHWRERARRMGLLEPQPDPRLAHEYEQEVQGAWVAACEARRRTGDDGDYRSLLQALYAFKEPLARFFGTGSEGVPVLIETDEERRVRRLALLWRILDLFGWFADFAKVSSR